MFQFFPRGRQEWLRVLLFPFQAYVVIAYLVEQYFIRSLPANGGYRGSLSEFKAKLLLGYTVCVLVLLSVGIVQMLAGRWLRGVLNAVLAALGVLIGLSMMNFGYT